MIENPARYIAEFIEAGADYLTVHIEADPHIHRTVQEIRRLGAKPGVVLNPGTPASLISGIIDEVDMVLVMTVNPGFGGQAFIKGVLPKIREIKRMATSLELNIDIEVDGGINAETAKLCAEAGANVFVAGSAIFGQSDRKTAIDELRRRIAE